MRILLIEDEPPAAKRLGMLIRSLQPEAIIEPALDTISAAVRRLASAPAPQLAFLDIQLADGLSFEIFQQCEVPCPVIFTTAYDQYTLRAFKQNSIDYLLKPVDSDELKAAIKKFERLYPGFAPPSPDIFNEIMAKLVAPAYKTRFLVRSGNSLISLPTSDFFYFFAEDGVVFAQTADKRYTIDYTLDQLQELLSPLDFFRLNRKVIARVEAVRKAAPYFNGRLLLDLNPAPSFEVAVSRDRAPAFKRWMDGQGN